MTNTSIYSDIIQTKNSTYIPVFSNGKTVDSKYNPQRDAENIINNLDQKYDFFIILGIASGVLISTLFEKYPTSKVLAIETSQEDIEFLTQLDLIQKLQDNEHIIFSDIEHIEEKLINNYLPALHGNIKIIEQRGWVDENKQLIPLINEKLNHGIGIISADYSVQSHFGKIWQSNIINNLKTLSKIENRGELSVDNSKTAIVVAAGPSMDLSIKIIKEHIDNYFIIATDTAYSILRKNKIIPDVVISIDGQFVSYNHFINANNHKTLFLLDLCSNYSVGNFLVRKGCNVIFFISGHPLSTLANNLSKDKFLCLFSGAGTVTITALDLAIKLGFKNINIMGADFAYINGKSYGKGSYFDSLYGITQKKNITLENQFENLMYRTDIKKLNKNSFTTTILNAYKQSMEMYLTKNNCTFTIENNIYNVKNQNQEVIQSLKSNKFDYDNFIKEIKSSTENDLQMPLLPYIAWLKNKKNNANIDFITLLKLAQSHIVSYN